MDDLRLRFAALDTVVVPDMWQEIERRVSAAPRVPALPVTRRAATVTVSPAFVLLIVGLLIAALATGLVFGAWLNQLVPPVQPSPTATAPSPTATAPSPTATAPSPTATALSAPGARPSPNPSLLHCGGHFLTEPIADLPTMSLPSGSPSAGLLASVGYSDQSGYWLDFIDPALLSLARRLYLSDYIPIGEPGGVRRLAWSPEGGLLAFDTAGDCYDAFVMSADGTRVWHILDGTTSERFDSWGADSSTWITTDAQRAVDDPHVYLRTIATDIRTDVIREAPQDAGDRLEGALPRTPSPDGRLELSQETPRQIDVTDLTTGVRRTIWRQPGAGRFNFDGPVWSPDSKQVAFLATRVGDLHRHWYVVNADGSNLRIVDGSWSDVAWQPVWPE